MNVLSFEQQTKQMHSCKKFLGRWAGMWAGRWALARNSWTCCHGCRQYECQSARCVSVNSEKYKYIRWSHRLKKRNRAISFSFNPLMQSNRSYNAILYNINGVANHTAQWRLWPSTIHCSCNSSRNQTIYQTNFILSTTTLSYNRKRMKVSHCF